MITKLVVENVLPFRGRIELRLDNQGLVLVRGRNEVSEAADSNGAGKTSLLHAICLGYFGVDLSGRRADAVACRFTEGPGIVEVHNEDALGAWGVRRQFRPSKLETWGIPGVAENEDIRALDEKVAQRLGLGLRTFKNAVVFGQGAFERFAGAGQDEQMKMLDEVQGVDFRGALERAKAWRGDLWEKLAAEKQVRSVAALALENLRQRLADLAAARDSFERVRDERVAQLRATGRAAEARRDATRKELDSARAAGLRAVELEIEQAKVKESETERATVERARGMAVLEAQAATRRLNDFEARLDALAKEAACPTCRQPIKSRTTAIRKLFDSDLARLTSEDVNAERVRGSAQRALDKCGERLLRQMAALGALIPGGEDAERHIAGLRNLCAGVNIGRLERAIRDAEVEAERADAQAEDVQSGAWDGSVMFVSTERDLAALMASEGRSAGTAERIEAAIMVADWCVEALGDRGIRSLLADGMADFVNERVAAHLEVLAAGEATMRMSTQTELKKGGARERISFKTEWAWGGVGPLDGSGGQDRREDLALFAAVQDLAESRSARPFPIKIFDEPFDALDARGKELAAAWVRGIARARGTALLITHSDELAALAEPDVTWTVVMTREGAHVEVS